jgi:hypothetical protein
VTSAAIVVMLGFFVWEFHHRLMRRTAVRETVAIQELARSLQAKGVAALPLTYVADSSFAIQLVLNTMRPPVSVDEAAALLRGDAAAFVVTAHLPKLLRALGTAASRAHVVARATDQGVTYLVVVSNRSELATDQRTAARVGPLLVTLTGVELGPTWDNVLDLRRGPEAGDAAIENVSNAPQEVKVRIDGGPGQSQRLAPRESLRIVVP